MVKLNDGLFVNWVFGITRVHRVTAAEKAASNDTNFREADEGDVVIKFSDGGGVRVKKDDGADEFLNYMNDVSDTLAKRRAQQEEAAATAEAESHRDFGDRFQP
jgi:GMP synthase PP-ATPase subunit